MVTPTTFAPAGLEQHPLSAAFPAMSPQDFDALRDSITDIGVQNPITLYEGMVLDGWHRYCAALELGQACPTQDFGTDDPVCFVKAQNKARRHLPIGAWALIEVSLREWMPAHRPEKRELSSPFLASNKDMANAVGVSERTIQQAKTVHTKAAPEVLEAVKRGDIGLPKAAAIAKLPAEEQAAAISPPLAKQAKALKAVKEPKAAPPAANDDQSDELAEAAYTITELAGEVEELRAVIAVGQMDAPEVERISAAELIADLRAQIKTLNAELAAMRVSRDTFQAENRELIKQLGMNAKELKRLRAA